jgi:hypothetical protein
MKASSDLHRMEAFFRSVRVPYVRGKLSVPEGWAPYVSVEGTTFLFRADGSFNKTEAHVAFKEVQRESNDNDQRPVD